MGFSCAILVRLGWTFASTYVAIPAKTIHGEPVRKCGLPLRGKIGG